MPDHDVPVDADVDDAIVEVDNSSTFNAVKYLADRAVFRRLAPDQPTRDERMRAVRREWKAAVKMLAEAGWPPARKPGAIDGISRCGIKGEPKGAKRGEESNDGYAYYSCCQTGVCPYCYAKFVVYPMANIWRDVLKRVDKESAEKKLPPVSVATASLHRQIDLSHIPGGLISAYFMLTGGSKYRRCMLQSRFGADVLGGVTVCSLSPASAENKDLWDYRHTSHMLVRGVVANLSPEEAKVFTYLPDPTLRGVAGLLETSLSYPVGMLRFNPEGVVGMLALPKSIRTPMTQRFGIFRKKGSKVGK
jgi:hypothetical protein